VAIGVGGYASAPTLNAAAAMGVPCLIQEQNSYAGVTNKSLAKKAQKICVAYDGMDRFFPAEKIIKTGNPVRQSLLSNTMTKEEARIKMGLKPDIPTILVIGGSLGARTINNAIADGISRFDERNIQVIWQTGKFYAEDCERITADHYRKADPDTPKCVHPMPFISDMSVAYKATDIVISRAGASSISELCLLGKAAVLVPSPNVAEDHQTKNARALSDKGAAVFVADNEAAKVLVEQAIALVSDPEQIKKLETEIVKLAIHNSADIIAEESIKLTQQ
jgi:UDP-N-acetylglucosamine--N-acetylmuramyl-(pentapeptide) pyrophosphoryl-undecaprenol N-acetylglucosamine transferase